MMRRLGILLAVILLPVGLGTARADLTIDIELANSGILPQGSTLQANVYISSDSGDTLGAYEYYFQITRTSGDGFVYFKDGATYDDLFDTNNYVFQVGTPPTVTNYSSNASNGAAFVGEVQTFNNPNDLFHNSLGDFSDAPSGEEIVVPPSSSRRLLTILTFTTASGTLLPSIGSTFDVTITAATDPDNPSSFTNGDFSDLVNFTGNTATWTIQGPASVPEPGTLTLLGLGLLGVAGYRFRRRAG
jgi:hypothetical protein